MKKYTLPIILLIATITSCTRNPPEEPAKPIKPFVLTDSNAIEFQKTLGASGGYWQLSEAIYVWYTWEVKGGDTVHTLQDSSQTYAGEGIRWPELPFYRFKFSKVVSEKDEMELTYTYFNHYFLNPGSDSVTARAYFDYENKRVFCDNYVVQNDILFDQGFVQIDSMSSNVIWISRRSEVPVYHTKTREHYKLERKN